MGVCWARSLVVVALLLAVASLVGLALAGDGGYRVVANMTAGLPPLYPSKALVVCPGGIVAVVEPVEAGVHLVVYAPEGVNSTAALLSFQDCYMRALEAVSTAVGRGRVCIPCLRSAITPFTTNVEASIPPPLTVTVREVETKTVTETMTVRELVEKPKTVTVTTTTTKTVTVAALPKAVGAVKSLVEEAAEEGAGGVEGATIVRVILVLVAMFITGLLAYVVAGKRLS